jgi:hypothetical protein
MRIKYYHIEDFPRDKIRILLDKEFKKEFWKVLKSVIGSDEKIAKIVKYPRSVITKMRLGKNSRGTTYFMPLWMVIKFSKILVKKGYKQFSLRNIEKHIIAYKTNSASSIITNPNLPLPEDERLIRIFTHLVGDGYGGGIYENSKKQKHYESPNYTNINKELANEFIEDLKVFGDAPYNKKEKWNCFKIILPWSIKYILEHIYKVKISASKGRFPRRFFNLPKKLIYQIIKAFCDDEGTIQDNGISVSSFNKRQLEDLRKFMILAGFNEKFITKVKLSSKNCYTLKFYGPNFILFGKEIRLTHPEKQAILDFQINRHLNHTIPQPKDKRIAKILELIKEPLTSIQIAQKLGISQNYTEIYLRELIRKGLVIKFRVRGKNKIAYISRLNYSSRTATMP